MPAAVSCPQCRKVITLDIHDPSGRVICPACGTSFNAAFGVPAPIVRPTTREITFPHPVPVAVAPQLPPMRRMPIVWGYLAGVASCALGVVLFYAIHSRPTQARSERAPVARAPAWPPGLSVLVPPVQNRPAASKPLPDDESDLPAPGKLFNLDVPNARAAPATNPSRLVAAKAQPVLVAVSGAPRETQPASSAKRQAEADPPPPSTAPAPVAETDAAPSSRPTLAEANPPAPPPVALFRRPPLHPTPPSQDQLLDQKIGIAIEKSIHNLLGQFSAGTYQVFQSDQPGAGLGGMRGADNGYVCGRNALAVYALMQAGLAVNDSRLKPEAALMRGLIEQMKRLPSTTGKVTYSRGIRATALALFDRPEDRSALQDDVTYLIRSQNHGAYTYVAMPHSDVWDNSNSQYGLLGVWSGAEVGIEVPEEYWAQVETHWKQCQFSDGRWSYGPRGTGPSLTMTAAGIASLFVTRQWLEFPKFRGDVGLDPFSPSLRDALKWWETGDNYLERGETRQASFGYGIYGIERVGLASGFKFFGTHEWYREMATQLVARQARNGSWGDVIDTSYVTLFLARGRHPVLMNKLRFDHSPGMNNRYWDNRPQDMNHLAKWSAHELERPINWQIVNLERDWPDFMDAPILYLASHRPLKFTEADYAKMRHFAEAGGLIFTQADGDSESFNRFAGELARRLFPNYEFQDVPPSHPLYSMNYDLKGQPPLKMVTNGSRILLLHSPKDISRYWEMRDDKLHKKDFQLGLNIFLYASGKRELRNKLVTSYVPEPPPLPKDAMKIKVLRLMYNGNWDPEPGSWERYGRVFQNATGSGLDLDSIQLKNLRPGMAPLAHLTGTAEYEFTPDEATALRNFVEQGGLVMIDACGGSGAFSDSMRKSVAAAFGGKLLARVPSNHPLLSLGNPGMVDLIKPVFRPFVLDKVGARFGGGFEMLSAGRGHVILSPLDLSSGMLGTNTWGIWGFTPDYCQNFLQNLLFWTVDGQADPRLPATDPPPSSVADPPAAQTAPAAPTTGPTTSAADAAIKATRPASTVHTDAMRSPASGPASELAPAASPSIPATQFSRPPLRPAPPTEDEILDARIGEAIERAQQALLDRFNPRTGRPLQLDVDGGRYKLFLQVRSPPQRDNGYYCGLDALAVYALMQAGLSSREPSLAPNAPLMSKLIDTMKRMPATNGHAVYARGIRATALALFNRREDRAALQDDVTYLLRVVNNGAYSYPVPRYLPLTYDNSNSQYGLLGVWSGAEVGIEVPQVYWEQVQRHWMLTQSSDGRWAYQPEGELTITMTDAGIASMFVTREWLEIPTFRGDVGRDPFSHELRKALDWYETGTNYQREMRNTFIIPGLFGYSVYGIERVGLASGFKFFGTHEWYREMAKSLLRLQRKDGMWGITVLTNRKPGYDPDQNLSDMIDTSYLLIFLARARHPVLMNKLRTDHVEGLNNRYWDNRPLDMHNLANWASHELERPLNWQIVNLERDWTDWMDAPVLYFASHRPLKFSEADCAKLRRYVENGGMIFTQADGDSSNFNDFVKQLAKKLFPNYEYQDVPPTHPIYSADYDLRGSPPPLKMVTNGSRILMLHSPKDVARYWETRDDKLHKRLFQLGLNVSLYASGKNEMRNKLATTYVPEPPPLPTGAPVIKVLRLRYNGNWDPEPGAWERYRRVFQKATGTGIDLAEVQLKDLRPSAAPFAHLTGTAAYELSPDESAALRAFVEQGGVVLIDACGGSTPFAESVRKSLTAAFEKCPLTRIPPSHPILQPGPPGMADLSKPLVRPYVIDKLGPRFAGDLEILAAGKGHLILSPLDLTSGLLGTNTWGIWGYAPGYAQSFLQNVIFWTVDGQRENAARM